MNKPVAFRQELSGDFPVSKGTSLRLVKGNTIVITGRKTAMEKLFKSVFLPVQALKNARTPEPGMLRSLVPGGISAICIGANVGEFMRRLHQLPEGRLVNAPGPQTMARMVLNVCACVRRKASIILFPFAPGARWQAQTGWPG